MIEYVIATPAHPAHRDRVLRWIENSPAAAAGEKRITIVVEVMPDSYAWNPYDLHKPFIGPIVVVYERLPDRRIFAFTIPQRAEVAHG